MTWTRNRTAVAIVVYLVLALATQVFFQQYGTRYLDDALLKATASFALARGLNGVITVVQESSVSAGMIVEGNVAVGQILDPVNDLIEGFSWIMLISIVSLGIQKLLIIVGVKAGLVLFGAALVALMIHWVVNQRAAGTSALGYRLLVLAIIVQAVVPLTSSIGAAVSETFLARRYEEAEGAITAVQQDLQAEFGLSEASARRLFERLDPRNLVQTVTQKAAEVTSHVIDLMIVFVFETVVMPLLTLLVLLLTFGIFLRAGDSAPAPRAELPSS